MVTKVNKGGSAAMKILKRCTKYTLAKGKYSCGAFCLESDRREHCPCSDHAGSSTAKRSKVTESNSSKISEVQQIVAKLQSKHGSKYSPEQYHAWAQLIQMGKQSSYDEAPNYTFFRNVSVSKKTSTSAPSQPVTSTPATQSPGKRVRLRTELFTQLEKLEGLFEKGSITKEQCEDLKKTIMGDIKEL